jgi:hypothetical protein
VSGLWVAALLVAAGCTPPPDCVPRSGEYHYNDAATLRLCKVTALDGACSEPWTLSLVRSDGTAFRGLGDVDEVSVPRSPSASWVLARRTVPSPPADVASMGTYLVYTDSRLGFRRAIDGRHRQEAAARTLASPVPPA